MMEMEPEIHRVSEELKRSKRKLAAAKKELSQARTKQKDHEKLIKYTRCSSAVDRAW